MAASADPKQISPKVLGALATTILLTVLATFLSLVTPDMLTALGPFAAPLAVGIAGGGAVLTAYLRMDPLRQDAALTLEAQRQEQETGVVSSPFGYTSHADVGLKSKEAQQEQDDRFKGNAG